MFFNRLNIKFQFFIIYLFAASSMLSFADCPSGDMNGDCFIDFKDVSIIGNSWLEDYNINNINILTEQWLTTNASGWARIIIAANNAHTKTKEFADYICDGIDDNVEIQNAINGLGATGGIVILTEGSFNITAPILLQSNCELIGSGDNTILNVDRFDDDAINAENKNNCAIKSFKLDSTKRWQSNARPALIRFAVCSNVKITDIWCLGFGKGISYWSSGDGIHIKDSNDVTISNCRIEGGYHNIMIGEGSQDVVIDNIISKNSGVEHICLEWTDAGSPDHDGRRGDRVTINNVVGYNAGQHGIFIQDYNNVTISNCSFYSTKLTDLRIYFAENINVTNFNSIDCESDVGAFYIKDSARNVCISNCIIRTDERIGCRIDANNVNISNCQIENPSDYGFRVTGEYVTIRGCSVRNVGGDDYPASFRIEGNNVTITDCISQVDYGDFSLRHFWLHSPSNVIIRGNSLFNGGQAFNLDSGCNGIIIQGNTISGLHVPSKIYCCNGLLMQGNIWMQTRDNPTSLVWLDSANENIRITENCVSGAYTTGDKFQDAGGTDITITNNLD